MSCFQIKSKKYDLENTSHTKMCVSRIFYGNETQDDVQTVSNKVKISNSLTVSDINDADVLKQIYLEFNDGTNIAFYAHDEIGQIFDDVKLIKFGELDGYGLEIWYTVDGEAQPCQSRGYVYEFPNDGQEHILEITKVDYDF